MSHTDIDRAATIKAARASLGLTQAQLAERIGVTREHVAAMEIGRVNVTDRTLRQIEALQRV
jgi:transcriptional regulator with XRE-family HTH domain